MTFEELITNNGEHPQLVEYLYSIQHASNFWFEAMMFFNSNHQKGINQMSVANQKRAKDIAGTLLSRWTTSQAVALPVQGEFNVES
jgi:hypothetical protein